MGAAHKAVGRPEFGNIVPGVFTSIAREAQPSSNWVGVRTESNLQPTGFRSATYKSMISTISETFP